ncbi:two-component sensor histidine kinase [Nonomuraea sp. KC401]|uniref:sensor histidine kinase n=1 Tax=unclassified Nonomuraea TaxID=2593643 RepID=UPI0010FCE06B|nr:ATP-binding protein [Nonomuraea sp. KC401]NBE97557.1 two-component sensor histidine kinase [Nonomuraea sp. K271]TLF64128.1 two-component sensor histidine kinase [Nonomuraea sp. KC401]
MRAGRALWWRQRAAAVTGAAGVVSLTATAGLLLLGREHRQDAPAGGWLLGESAALLVLIMVTVRVAPARHALLSVGPAGVALPVLLLRFGTGPPTLAAVAGFAVWVLSALLAAMVGLYLRSLDERRARSVRAARQAQRAQLAQDLHDFVAHDVSEMLAQAQAGQILAEQDPRQSAAVFRRIEHAAQQALASMDRTVRMLHEDDLAAEQPAHRTPLPGLADLRELAGRFSSSGSATVHLDVDAADGVPREVAATAYRVVVESLTNVRRHAVTASRVEVSVRRTPAGDALEVTVTDDATTGPAPSGVTRGVTRGGTHDGLHGGGRGLAGLAERVEALGGTLTAGPHAPCGWRVAATFPLASAPLPTRQARA